MEYNAEEDEKATFDQLSGWFEQLTSHYETQHEQAEEAGWYDDEDLPVTVAEIRTVYKHIGYQDNGEVDEFDTANGDDHASTLDLTVLFDKLSEHYYNNFDAFTQSKDDISENDEHALAVIFSKMAQYYSTGEGKAENPYADDLLLVYTQLMESFGIKAEDE